MKHPFQILLAGQNGEHLFASVKNHLLAYRMLDGKLVGSWSDDVDLQSVQKEKFWAKRAEEQRLRDLEQPTKKAKTNQKVPKVPVPGPGAPVIYNYIRSLTLTRDGNYIIGTTDSDKAAVIFRVDYSKDNCLQLVKRQVFPKRPCAVLTSIDDSRLVLADKFGDVYEIPIDASEPVLEKDLVPILGHVSMLSDVLITEIEGKQFVLTGDRDEHIKVTHYPKSYVVKHWLFGHREFVSCLHICSFDKKLLISGGGDEYLLLWNWFENQQLARVELRNHVQEHLTDAHYPPERFAKEDPEKEISIAKVATTTQNGKNLILVLCENTNCIVIFSVDESNTVTLQSKLVTEIPIIDFALLTDSVMVANDSDEVDSLLTQFHFNKANELVKYDSSVANKISESNICEIESRKDVYPLYYVHSLRKRSEH